MSLSLPTLPYAEKFSSDSASDLLVALRAVPDPRRGGGRRYRVEYVLAVLVAAFSCAGFESFTGAAQWATAADRELLIALGAAPDALTGRVCAPSEATLRRMACRVDAPALEAVVAAWVCTQLGTPEPDARRVAVAMDGKTVRGARVGDVAAPHLLAAATHDHSVVLAQRRVPGKTNEIPMVATLLGDMQTAGHDVSAMVISLDALHTQHSTARLLDGAGAGYVMCVKGNQPGLRAAIVDRLRQLEPASTGQRSRGHGRTEERILRVTTARGIDFPGAQQVFRIIRHTGGLDGQRTRKEVVHGITNLTPEEADPAKLAALVRGHWSIENKIHWCRDVTYREDANRARTGNAPQVLAVIRNIVTTVLRLAGAPNIAAARRGATLNPKAMIRLLTRTANQDNSSL